MLDSKTIQILPFATHLTAEEAQHLGLYQYKVTRGMYLSGKKAWFVGVGPGEVAWLAYKSEDFSRLCDKFDERAALRACAA